jgi:14-3-3 protein epsilon
VIPNKHHIKGAEAIVFFRKMLADFNRYLCEYPEDHKARKHYLEQASSHYTEAEQIARSNLPQTNPVRLSLHLNTSVFLWEVREERERGVELANRAFEEAIANIDTVNEENYKECTMILQLMRDNITLWGGEEQ